MFYSWRKDSVHSLKHIPGFMKRVKDGGRRFERNEDWLNPPFQPSQPPDEEVILTLCWCLSLLSEQNHLQQIASWSVSRNTSLLHTTTVTGWYTYGKALSHIFSLLYPNSRIWETKISLNTVTEESKNQLLKVYFYFFFTLQIKKPLVQKKSFCGASKSLTLMFLHP